VYSVDVTNKREEMMAPGNVVNKYDWKYSDVLEDGKQSRYKYKYKIRSPFTGQFFYMTTFCFGVYIVSKSTVCSIGGELVHGLNEWYKERK
jgi:hypothetical protein